VAVTSCGIIAQNVLSLLRYLSGVLRKSGSKSKSLERDGDRVIYADKGNEKPFERVEDFLERLDG